jgi:hypothetical protein
MLGGGFQIFIWPDFPFGLRVVGESHSKRVDLCTVVTMLM